MVKLWNFLHYLVSSFALNAIVAIIFFFFFLLCDFVCLPSVKQQKLYNICVWECMQRAAAHSIMLITQIIHKDDSFAFE